MVDMPPKKRTRKTTQKKTTQKKSSNRYSNGIDYDFEKGSVDGFMESHNVRQRRYMHAVLHGPREKDIGTPEQRKELHDKIVKKDIKNHHTPYPAKRKRSARKTKH